MKYLLIAALTVIALGLVACESPQPVDDAGITAKVKSKLALDARTTAIKVNVDTLNGVVTLSGTVPAESEKAAAGEVAKMTEGVKNVNNNIVVNPDSVGVTNVGEKTEAAMKEAGAKTEAAVKEAGAKTEAAVKEAGEAVGDAAILAKIKAKFVTAGIIGTNVDVKEGVVVIKGTVEDASEKANAEKLARDTDGVKSVTNQVTIEKKKK